MPVGRVPYCQNNMENQLITFDKSFIEKVSALKEEMYQKYLEISREKTPEYDVTGNKIIKKRPDGLDYLEEGYMRSKLDKHFPGWSWKDGQIQLLGSEWLLSNGHLYIIDEYLLAFGIIPPYRIFFSTGAARIQFKKGMEHIAENVVDIDKNISAANSNALKRSINRLCHIGDDIYGKRIDDEGAGTMEEVMSNAGSDSTISRNMFFNYIKQHNILSSNAMKTLHIGNWTEIHDWIDALNKIKGVQ